MAKSLTKKRTTIQATDCLDSGLDASAIDSNTRKKAKTLSSDSKFIYYLSLLLSSPSFGCFLDPSDQTRRSSRVNKGSGGQIAQLRNIEHIQTQAIARVSPMDVATANEPFNPLAPLSDKQPPRRKSHPLKGNTGEQAGLICRSSRPQTHCPLRFLHPRRQ